MVAPRVCLAMNAKEKLELVERAIRSALPLIDCYCVTVEPGDPLGEQMRAMLGDLPGEVIEFVRESGGQMHTVLFEHAERVAAEHGATYILNLDADDYLVIADDFAWPDLTDAAYAIDNFAGTNHWPFLRIFRVGLGWRWIGALHERAECDAFPPGSTPWLLEGISYAYTTTVARGPGRAREHARILAAEVERDPSNARNVYYLAQSYRDAGMVGDIDVDYLKLAYETYSRRAAMGGFVEEVYCSLFECGRMLQLCGQPWASAQECYLKAHAIAPHRAEPLFMLASYWHEAGSPAVALVFARAALGMPVPFGAQMVDASVYDWRIPDLVAELADATNAKGLSDLARTVARNRPALSAAA